MLRKLLMTTISVCLATSLANAASGIVKGEIVESINAAGYTYLKIKTIDNQNKWAAVMQGDYKVGNSITVTEDMTTQNFQSKALGVTFDTIVFGKVAKNSMDKPKKIDSYEESKIVKTTIEELINKSDTFKDKIIQAKGKVTKISKAIMKSNWIHIEDEKGNKIIFRSLDDNVQVGQQATATGKANIDVDYGYGYKYKIIVTDSVFK